MQVSLNNASFSHPAAKVGASPAFGPATFVLQAGERVAVIGPSGAGKTTLLHGLACALKPVSGSALLGSINPWQISLKQLQVLRGRLFLAPQASPLPPRQRVITAVLAGKLAQQSLWVSLRSLFYPMDIAGAHHALARFDLDSKLWDRVDRLSGGERQRVGLARLLVSNASLWLVDEPLSALDPTRADLAIETLTSTARECGATLIASLHQVDVALTSFDRIIGLRDGLVEFDLPAAQVTEAMLKSLYRSFEHELAGENAPVIEPIQASALPIVMNCR